MLVAVCNHSNDDTLFLYPMYAMQKKVLKTHALCNRDYNSKTFGPRHIICPKVLS